LPVDSPNLFKDNRIWPVVFSLEGGGSSLNLILVAVGLMMVFEGIPLFCFPDQLKELARKLPEFENKTLRFIGLALMLLGLAVVYLGKGAINNP
jgi:uncharacterized protein YjeT (DUF2065 family)